MAKYVWTAAALLLVSMTGSAAELSQDSELEGFPTVSCIAEQTGGFHDHPEAGEFYEPVLFHPIAFTLEENPIFMMNFGATEGGPDLYLTLHTSEERETELECRKVRGNSGKTGYSCVNKPPSEMLLINRESLRFTRTAVGGWTFAGAVDDLNGDSIFVEYGTCRRQQQ